MPALMRRKDGTPVWMPDEQVSHAESLGMVRQASSDVANDLTPVEDTEGGAGGAVKAGLSSVASGATLGLSDVALRGILNRGDLESVRRAREEHPIVSTIGTMVGAIAPAVLTGGESAAAEAPSLLSALPSAKLARIGSRIVEGGDGAGVVGRAAASATAGAAEGALQNAGSYVSDVALGDRKLSADGFIGAMGQGALWGGVAGGALQLTSEGMTAARRLFPGAETTAEAATAARHAATSEIAASLEDSSALATKAEAQLRDLGAQEELTNPTYRQRVQEIKLRAAQDVADAQVARAKAQAAGAELTTKSKAARLAKAEAAAKTKPVMNWLDSFTASAPLEEGASRVVSGEMSGDGLLAKLTATKQGLDAGSKLSELTNAELAKVNPAARKINDALVESRSSADAMRSWLAKYGGDSAVAYDAASPALRKAKIADWAKGAGDDDPAAAHFLNDPVRDDTYRLGPNASPEARKAANAAGADAAHAAFTPALAEATNVSGSGTEAMARARYASQRAAAKAQDEVHTAFRAPTGDEILGASPTAKIGKALAAHPATRAEEIVEAAPVITKHEAAHANLTEALGPNASPASQARAGAFRDAQRESTSKAQDQIALTADAIDKAAPQSLGKRMLAKAGDAGATYEALRMMGVPLPDPHSLPVIGPLLSVYLKAKVIGRLGGKVGATAEATIATKAAATRQRIYAAADAMLAGGAKATRAAAAVSGGAAAALGHSLFAGPDAKSPPYSSEPKLGELGELYLARASEIDAATKPGAIAASVKARIMTSDPEALQEIVATKERQLQFLSSKMPRPNGPPSPLEGRIWLPAKADLQQWAKLVGATEDPAGVLERAGKGGASADEIDAVKTVYPSLYADAQRHVIEALADGKGHDLPQPQRAALSRAWGLPLDMSMQTGHAAFLQAGYQPTTPAPQPSAPMGQPTITGPINLGQRMMPRLDQGV